MWGKTGNYVIMKGPIHQEDIIPGQILIELKAIIEKSTIIVTVFSIPQSAIDRETQGWRSTSEQNNQPTGSFSHREHSAQHQQNAHFCLVPVKHIPV